MIKSSASALAREFYFFGRTVGYSGGTDVYRDKLQGVPEEKTGRLLKNLISV